MAFVYWIYKSGDTDFTTSGYIGVTVRSVEERYEEHKRAARSGADYTIHKAIRKYGDSLVVETLVEGPEDYCYEIEHKLRPTYGIGYNCAAGGATPSMSGLKHTEETKKKISEAFKGSKHPRFGKTVSEDTKQKISMAQKGEKGNQWGKKLSEETKLKIALWRENNPHPNLGLPPYEAPHANKTVWSRAVEVFNFVKEHPTAGIRKTAKHFNGTDGMWQTLYNKIKSGWNPLNDEKYLAWLDQYNKTKEAPNAQT